ncbi:MAG: class I SAM-dependent methyltransferase [Acidobacteriota bacterium]
MSALRIPDRSVIERIDREDPLPFYYNPLTGWVYRRRLALALEALGPGPYETLLEVGYGSGILLPELCRRARKVHAVDLHEKSDAVRRMLEAERVSADLATGSILDLPYDDGAFDALVCLSVLEHMDDVALPKALVQIRRVCRPGATVVLGFPVRNLVTDTFFRAVGFHPREIHPSSHRDIVTAARSAFPEVVPSFWPPALPVGLSLYATCRCRTRS